MKKLNLLLALLFVSTLSFAQIEVDFGGKVGLNVSNLSNDINTTGSTFGGLKSDKASAGLVAGITSDVSFYKYVGLGVELLYSQQGTFQSFPEINTSNTLNLDYITIPILAKVNVGGASIYSGIQPGFLVNATSVVKVGDIKTEFDLKDQDETYNFKTLKEADFSIPFGIGYKAPFGMTVDARYTLGLTSVFEGTEDSSDKTPKNRVFQIALGFRI